MVDNHFGWYISFDKETQMSLEEWYKFRRSDRNGKFDAPDRSIVKGDTTSLRTNFDKLNVVIKMLTDNFSDSMPSIIIRSIDCDKYKKQNK